MQFRSNNCDFSSSLGLLIRLSYTSAADPGFVAHSAWRASGAAGAAGAAKEAALDDAAAAAGNAAGALPDSADAFAFLPDPANLYRTS